MSQIGARLWQTAHASAEQQRRRTLTSRLNTSHDAHQPHKVNELLLKTRSFETEKKPKAEVTIKPAQHVFRGDTVTLRCEINGEGVTNSHWYKEGLTGVFSTLKEHTFSSVTESDAGKYYCYGSATQGSDWSQMSDAVTLTVSGEFDHLFIHTNTRLMCYYMSDFFSAPSSFLKGVIGCPFSTS
ncbi:V-set and transmembrane domain-containing protein 1 [Labeo rohita]|uniref:V-set and transmembrane domain-containing protein 1 n=1 Tax=Labeo rohita TaxID=84645 RepID=A0ABQ8LBQ0_LABRO|nr:V-set and transmembrane domain-containing protein 1 [Labeo rohita]